MDRSRYRKHTIFLFDFIHVNLWTVALTNTYELCTGVERLHHLLTDKVAFSVTSFVRSLQNFQGAVLRAISRAGLKLTPSQFVNDILHGMYDKEYLSKHALAGGNSEKVPLDAGVVQAVTGK